MSPSFTGPFKTTPRNNDRMPVQEGDFSELTNMISEINEKRHICDLIIWIIGVLVIIFSSVNRTRAPQRPYTVFPWSRSFIARCYYMGRTLKRVPLKNCLQHIYQMLTTITCYQLIQLFFSILLLRLDTGKSWAQQYHTPLYNFGPTWIHIQNKVF